MSFSDLAAAGSRMINSSNETVNILEHVTNGFKTIDTDHAYIHDGLLYEASYKKSISANGVINIVLTTPSDEYIHYRPAKISSSADLVTIGLYENCSVSGGAALTPYNHNRNITAASSVTIVSTANVTSDGTLISQLFIGGGSGVASLHVGAETLQQNEWVLKQSINYCLRLTNGSTGAQTININNLWYEEEAT